METFKIKSLLTAIEEKSLSRAATQLSYSPSSFSHMLTTFEKELGIHIFKRSSKGVELNANGKALYPYFIEMLEAEERLLKKTAELLEQKNSRLRIGMYSSVLRNLLTPIINDFQEKNPDIKISISVDGSLVQKIDNNSADIVFADDAEFRSAEKSFVPVFEDRCYVIAPKGYFPNKSLLTREELYDYKYIITREECLKNYFDMQSFKKTMIFDSEDSTAIANMVKNGFGITVVPELYFKDQPNELSVIPLEPKVSRIIGYTYKKDNESPALSTFLDFLNSKLPPINI